MVVEGIAGIVIAIIIVLAMNAKNLQLVAKVLFLQYCTHIESEHNTKGFKLSRDFFKERHTRWRDQRRWSRSFT